METDEPFNDTDNALFYQELAFALQPFFTFANKINAATSDPNEIAIYDIETGAKLYVKHFQKLQGLLEEKP